MKQTYISPELQQQQFDCEQGFLLSTDIGGWEEGGEYGGDAE